MISLIIGIMVSLVVTIVGTPLLIKLVHKLNYGQYIRQDGPKSHLVKRGTPTLGGVVINLAVVLGWCSSALYRFLTRGEVPSWSAVLVLFAMLSMGLLGFIDDFAKVRKKQNLGLSVHAKFIGQFIFATIFQGIPFLACSASLSIIFRKRSFIQIGATIRRFQLFGSEYPESMLNTAVASSPNRSSQVNIPQSV